MSIPKTIHFTIPEHPSDEQLKNIQTARELHPDWNATVWQDPLDRANFVLSKYWDKVNSGAQLADLIRLEVVFQHGGFYLDSDFQLLRSLDPLRVYPFVIASQDGLLLPNSFFAATPNSPVLKHLIDTLDGHEPDWTVSPVYTTGPNFFTREMKWRDDITVIPRETFYPYDWNERARASRLWTYGVHRWEHSWKYSWSTTPRFRQMLRTARHATRQNAIKGRRWFYRMLRNFVLKKRRQLQVFHSEPYSASGVICAQTLHGPRILLVGEDASVTPEMALHGTLDFPEECFVQRVVRLGDWVIDVGANVGVFTLLFAQSVGLFGRVFSYEPNPLPAALLKKSLVMNWFHDRTEVRQKALGSDIGTRQLRFSRGRLGDSTLLDRGAAGSFEHSMSVLADEEKVDVEITTLDTDFPVDLPIRLLKVDVEGFEHHVLRGASRLLEKQCIDILMLECRQEVSGQNWAEYLQELEKIVGYGYDTYRLNSAAKLRPITFRQVKFDDQDKNIFLVSKHAKDTIRELS